MLCCEPLMCDCCAKDLPVSVVLCESFMRDCCAKDLPCKFCTLNVLRICPVSFVL